MQVTIHASGFVLTEALRRYTEQRIRTALGWAGQHLRTLAVFLADINGPRGGIDKRCRVQVQLTAGRSVIIEDIEADLYTAIDRAADRADRAVLRQVERKRGFDHTRIDAPDALVDEDRSDPSGGSR